MIKGGYKIINLNDVTIDTTNGTTIKGIYHALENNYRKSILISGIVIDGVEKADTFTDVNISDSNYIFSVYGKTYTVNSSDVVTIA